MKMPYTCLIEKLYKKVNDEKYIRIILYKLGYTGLQISMLSRIVHVHCTKYTVYINDKRPVNSVLALTAMPEMIGKTGIGNLIPDKYLKGTYM